MADVDGYRHSAKLANLPDRSPREVHERERTRRPSVTCPPIRDRSGPVLSWDRGENLEEIATDATPLYIK